MKKRSIVLAFGAAALLIGCGGGGGGGNNDAEGGDTSSSSSSTTSSASSSSSSSGGGTGTDVLTVNSVDDVKGYTLHSNESTVTLGEMTLHQTITLSIACDGTFVYTIQDYNEMFSSTDVAKGDEVYLDTSYDPYELSWYGTWQGGGAFEAGEAAGDILPLSNTDQIIAGTTCWLGYGVDIGVGEDCPMNIYIESITQDDTCN